MKLSAQVCNLKCPLVVLGLRYCHCWIFLLWWFVWWLLFSYIDYIVWKYWSSGAVIYCWWPKQYSDLTAVRSCIFNFVDIKCSHTLMIHAFLTCFHSDAQVLVNLYQAVIPHLSNPIMLWWILILNQFSFLVDLYAFILTWSLIPFLTIYSDFLTRSYDIGGVISVMALSSLFVLMTQHGLEYPNFYEKLYALLVPSIFMAKHRAKFFQVIDMSSLIAWEV